MNDPYSRIPKQQLRAKGNLSYLEFIRLVGKLWEDAHPDIPLQPTADKSFPKYPVITYRLDFRKPHPSEPKPKYREEMATEAHEDAILISGQRFQNLITFTVLAKSDPHLAEQVIEVFEDFMMEFQPVFKELGASELVYARRIPDTHDTRPGEGINSRSVSYLLTTEKIIKTSVSKLEEILVDARLFLSAYPIFFVAGEDPEYPSSIRIYSSMSFAIGDKLTVGFLSSERLRNYAETETQIELIYDLPPELSMGAYVVTNFVEISGVRRYELARVVYGEGGETYIPVEEIGEGSGTIVPVIEKGVTVNIYDQMAATPNSP